MPAAAALALSLLLALGSLIRNLTERLSRADRKPRESDHALPAAPHVAVQREHVDAR
jgi:hypothetical protein